MLSTTQQIRDLRALLAHRWSVSILAELGRTGGARFVPLAHGIGVSQQSLRRSLDALIDDGFVMRNPGYGHPSRPEYVLTEKGRAAAPACAAVLRALREADVEQVGLRRWSLPILAATRKGRRFSELKALLPDITPRALTLTLKDLARAGLVVRTVHDSFPPRTTYRSTRSSRSIVAQSERLATALADLRTA